MTINDTTRIRALATHLDIDVESVEKFGDNSFKVGREEYLVLTDEEADRAVRNDIRESLWAFRPEAKEMIEFFCAKKCEDANDTIFALIDDFDKFVTDAVLADGRGHFLAGYDGEEHEVDHLFIYRIN
jgi:hypothetical protein